MFLVVKPSMRARVQAHPVCPRTLCVHVQFHGAFGSSVSAMCRCLCTLPWFVPEGLPPECMALYGVPEISVVVSSSIIQEATYNETNCSSESSYEEVCIPRFCALSLCPPSHMRF